MEFQNVTLTRLGVCLFFTPPGHSFCHLRSHPPPLLYCEEGCPGSHLVFQEPLTFAPCHEILQVVALHVAGPARLSSTTGCPGEFRFSSVGVCRAEDALAAPGSGAVCLGPPCWAKPVSGGGTSFKGGPWLQSWPTLHAFTSQSIEWGREAQALVSKRLVGSSSY